MDDPVLFYFWTHGSTNPVHNHAEELNTPTLYQLADRAQTVFLELVSPNGFALDTFEADLNTATLMGRVPSQLERYCLALRKKGYSSSEWFFAQLWIGSRKRILLEKTLEPSFDYLHELDKTSYLFFTSSFERALEQKLQFLALAHPYQQAREQAVAEQIARLSGTVLVLFGASHYPSLSDLVAQKRPTEFHFPSEDYPIHYDSQCWLHYQKTGLLDHDLFLRECAEGMFRGGLNSRFGSSLSSCQKDLLAHRYATLLTCDQILDLRDYFVTCTDFGASPADIVDSYLLRVRLPAIDAVLAELA